LPNSAFAKILTKFRQNLTKFKSTGNCKKFEKIACQFINLWLSFPCVHGSFPRDTRLEAFPPYLTAAASAAAFFSTSSRILRFRAMVELQSLGILTPLSSDAIASDTKACHDDHGIEIGRCPSVRNQDSFGIAACTLAAQRAPSTTSIGWAAKTMISGR
jgi:hypothetical protein